MNVTPLVSVVIPVFDQWDHLRTCLRHLAAQTLDHDRFEVVVVDNGSLTAVPGDCVPDGLRVRWLREQVPGSYAARNRGVAETSAPLVAFTDADCRPEPQWLQALLDALEGSSRPSLVGGAIALFPQDPHRPTPVEAYELVKAFPQQRYVTVQGFAATANLLVRREVFDVAGPFDDRLRSGGDREFGQRATAAGCTIAYAAAAVVRHPARRTFRELLTKLRRVTAGSRDARRLDGLPLVTAREVLHGLLPPVGAARRARRDPRLPRLPDKVGYVTAEFFVRYVGTALRVASAATDAPSPRS